MRIVGGGDLVFTLAKRARAWVLAGALIGAVVGLAVHFGAAPRFRAVTTVELSVVPAAVDLEPGDTPTRPVSIDTDAQLVGGDAVVEAVAEAVDRDEAAVRRSLTIAARPLTRVLVLTYSGRSAREASTGVRAAADAFLKERDRVLIDPLRSFLLEVAETQEQESTAPAQIVDPATSGRVFPRPVLDNRRRRAVEESLDLPGAGRTLETSALRPKARRGQIEVPVMSGAALGGLIGLGIGLARTRTRRSRRLEITWRRTAPAR